MALEEHRVVRTAVPLAGGGDRYRLGSGYLISDGLVLTATHVLEQAEGVAAEKGQAAEAACIGSGWQQATVVWVDAGQDVAILACPALRAGGGIRWGRLTGSDPLDWGAVGFPVASLDEAEGRQAEHAFGRTSPMSNRAAGRLALTVESREATGGDSPWAGLSGAAVFCGDHLVGVITTDPGTYSRSLVGRRVEDFCQDNALVQLLGSAPAFEDVAGSIREPGLPDLRSTLRSQNCSFTGRKLDLAALSAEPLGRTVLTQSLVGLGGVGKSALALEYAHRRYEAGEVDLAWWFVAEDRSVLLASMARLYARLTGTPGSGEDAEAGAVALRNWLERSPYRWILIFDNAELGTLEGIVPEDGTGQVIITSRSSGWRDVASTRVVGRLPPDEAVALLADITELPADEDARLITEELGGLALAIEQAAAYIRQTGAGYWDYLDALRADPRAVYDADLAQTESVAARVWRRSLDHVTGGQEDHPAAVVLGIMSYLAPDDIPRQLFNPGSIQATPTLSDLGTVKLTVALAELAAYSLIILDRDAINVHRVIQHITRLDADARGRTVEYCATAIGLLDACVSSRLAEKIPAGRLLRHVVEATAHAQELGAAPGPAVSVLNSVADTLLDGGQLDTCRLLLDRALAIAQAKLGPDHQGTLRTRNNLTSWLAEAGQPEKAAAQLRRLLDDRVRMLGADHTDTLATRGNLASWLGESGQVEEAVSQFRELLDDQVRVLGPDHPHTLITRGNLAYRLGESGQVEEAVSQFRELLDDQVQVLGPDHPHTLATRDNLASCLGESGQVEEAVSQFRELLDDHVRVLGPDHPDTLATRDNLASCLGESGQVEEAVSQFRELLDDHVRVLGPDHPDTLATRGNLASCLGESGQVEEAVSQFRELLDDQVRVLGPDHPHTLITRGNLASCLGESGQVEEAVSQFRELLDDQVRVLGPDHPHTLITRGNLASWLGKARQAQ